MAKLVFKLQDISPSSYGFIQSTESGTGNGADLLIQFDSRYVSRAAALEGFAAFVAACTA